MGYVLDFSQGSRDMRDTLGGKGAGLAEMTRVLGEQFVPSGFTITTEACVDYMRADGQMPAGLEGEVDAAMARLEATAGKRFGDREDPLLVSVRSGARVSMPGMLDTVLNLGLNDDSVEGVAARSGNPRFAWDSYRRLLQMFGGVVRGVPATRFEKAIREARDGAGVASNAELDADRLRALAERFKAIVASESGQKFPQEPRDQLEAAIRAVFDSWNGKRAVAYRLLNRIPDQWGTAVTVQRMVFGNRGEDSGSGVAFTRDTTTGAPGPSGDYLANAQGEDVVAGVRNTEDLARLGERLPAVYSQLLDALTTLERHYRDMQDVEFTVEDGRLYLLQTRNAKRPAQAAVRFARDAVAEGLLSKPDALATIDASSLDALLHPTFDPAHSPEPLTRGVAASPGAAKGAIVFSAAEAVRRGEQGDDVILVRPFTEADDVAGFYAARGILTSEGGKSSHAALVARGMGRPCVVAAADLDVDLEHRVMRVRDTELEAGALIAIDGSTGVVTLDDVELITPEIGDDFREILAWADEIRRLRVRANADNPEDAARARSFGAEGIGLCRTEHMFFGEDREHLVKEMFLAAERWRRASLRDYDAAAADAEGVRTGAERELRVALERLGELQRHDFVGIFRAMAGLPITIRLLDPPLHEFLPVEHFESELEGLGPAASEAERESARERLALARDLREANPMLGMRGVRLGIVFPPLYEMQVRSIVAAALEVAASGEPPELEIMLPLIAYETELAALREVVENAAGAAMGASEATVEYHVGTMIELPRACLIAARIAANADFFSFGTNDLTQTTIGFSRDDVERGFLTTYLAGGVIGSSPFATIDEPGVGELMQLAAERGRSANPELGLGVCGEHAGDPQSIEFFERIGLDYVSCSPYRVPIARVASAQAVTA